MKRFDEKKISYLILLYIPIYFLIFCLLERGGTTNLHIIECALDRKIPFVEYFVIPYYLWFAYIGLGGFYFFLFEKKSFLRFMYVAIVGMTLFLFISWVYPNGLQLRPHHFDHDNIFITLTRKLYAMDTSTNVFPSIHVYNSLALHAAVTKSERLKEKKIVKKGSLILCILIILSTMFLKQHSCLDVISAILLFGLVYGWFYGHSSQDHKLLQ